MLINYISIYLVISVIVITFLSAFIQARGKADYLKFIFLLSLAIDIYIMGYVLELHSDCMEQMLFWNYFQYLGIPFVSALWLTIALMYTNHFYRYLPAKLFFIYSVPVLALILRFTNDLHHLYFRYFKLQPFDSFTLLVKKKGIGYNIQSVHSGLLIFISLAVFIYSFIKSKDYNVEKVMYIISTSIFACLGLVLNVLKIAEVKIDYMVLCLPVTIIFITLAIMRNDFLETKMLARDLVFEKSDEGIILVNNKYNILDFNETAKTIMNNHNVSLRKEAIDSVLLRENQLNDIFRASSPVIWKDESAEGVKYYEITTTDILRKNGTVRGKIKTMRDITEVQLQTNHLKVQATTDELSGLLNRREFISSCQAYLNNSKAGSNRYYLLMLDIDFFKRVNDTYGHVAGDYVIKKIGELLRHKFSKPALAGRLGGEEFSIFIKEQNIYSARKEAEKLKKSVEALQIQYEEKVIKITISIGIAEVHKADSISNLLKKADKALYASKNSGRNKINIYGATV